MSGDRRQRGWLLYDQSIEIEATAPGLNPSIEE